MKCLRRRESWQIKMGNIDQLSSLKEDFLGMKSCILLMETHIDTLARCFVVQVAGSIFLWATGQEPKVHTNRLIFFNSIHRKNNYMKNKTKIKELFKI